MGWFRRPPPPPPPAPIPWSAAYVLEAGREQPLAALIAGLAGFATFLILTVWSVSKPDSIAVLTPSLRPTDRFDELDALRSRRR